MSQRSQCTAHTITKDNAWRFFNYLVTLFQFFFPLNLVIFSSYVRTITLARTCADIQYANPLKLFMIFHALNRIIIIIIAQPSFPTLDAAPNPSEIFELNARNQFKQIKCDDAMRKLAVALILVLMKTDTVSIWTHTHTHTRSNSLNYQIKWRLTSFPPPNKNEIAFQRNDWINPKILKDR